MRLFATLIALCSTTLLHAALAGTITDTNILSRLQDRAIDTSSSPDNHHHLAPRSPKKTRPSKEWKYFKEAGKSAILGHYDKRFFKGHIAYADRRLVMHHLTRSYLTAFRSLDLETWLAHGTLLGWWWNGETLPWDSDIDMQVSEDTLTVLADKYNLTMHEYHYMASIGPDGKEYDPRNSTAPRGRIQERAKTYMLDINPHHVERSRVNGKNVIDARWVDTETGAFIDITGVSQREKSRAPDIWACKNNHRYRTADLWPMRETEFEGVPATVPRAFDSVLVGEYGQKSLVMREWGGHEWNTDARRWIKKPPQTTL